MALIDFIAFLVVSLNIVFLSYFIYSLMKGTKVQTLGARAVAGAWCIWLIAWAIIIMAMGAIINTHAHR